jgi:hypothetical protein
LTRTIFDKVRAPADLHLSGNNGAWLNIDAIAQGTHKNSRFSPAFSFHAD